MVTSPWQLVETLKAAAQRLGENQARYDRLIERIGNARFVLLGEASHGTHDFYVERAYITRRLIEEQHFTAVAVEADWPDAYRVNRYVRGVGPDASSDEALAGFRGRFPTWMWRNTVVREFIDWLRIHNDRLPSDAARIGFYGLDLYNLSASINAVISYLEKVDPEAARRARARYGCFEDFQSDPQLYGYAAGSGRAESCEDEVVAQLVELQRKVGEYAGRDGRVASDEHFYAEQNARLARNAEEYYRSMFRGRVSSWNLRDSHMAETLDALVAHLDHHTQTKVVVWAHNSHLGDARATEMGQTGEHNLGQLVRERYGDEAYLIGFSTYHGTVTAATDWDDPPELKRVRPGMPGSYEAIFHELGIPRLLLFTDDCRDALLDWRLQRAIGVIYRPQTERQSHYFNVRLADQFDAMIHLDETRAIEPLERTAGWETGEPAETFPSGL